jgi:hypothetical protein
MAAMDAIYRTMGDYGNVGIKPDTRDIDDLIIQISKMDKSFLKGQQRCLLNPTFEILIEGLSADADIIIDDLLIDIKSTATHKGC